MFEYASLVGICIYRGLDPDSCAHMTNIGSNSPDLPVTEFINVFQLSLNSSRTCQIVSKRYIYEKTSSFDKDIMQVSSGSMIIGYLQSWRYFHPHGENVVRKMFDLPQQVTTKAESLLISVRNKLPPDFKVIGVHIRRGDKVNNNQNVNFYDQWALSEDYYQKAVQLLTRRHPRCALLFFTGGGTSPDVLHNDRVWVKQHFDNMTTGTSASSSTKVFFDHSEDHFVSFKALSLCDAIVVAHSSFSWWSAYLSTSTMEVVAPYQLFSDRKAKEAYVAEDYYLPWWSLIAQNSSEDRIIGHNPFPSTAKRTYSTVL
jgi:hypothetical protein